MIPKNLDMRKIYGITIGLNCFWVRYFRIETRTRFQKISERASPKLT